MIDRQDMITLLMPLLEEAMREKAAKNGHKKPLSEETDSDLRDMAHAENGEFELELAWVKRFGRDPRAVLLEMADWIILRAEQARRVGAIFPGKEGLGSVLVQRIQQLEEENQKLEKALKFQKDQNKMLLEGRRGL